jgi:hypothetical protein
VSINIIVAIAGICLIDLCYIFEVLGVVLSSPVHSVAPLFLTRFKIIIDCNDWHECGATRGYA